MINFDKFTWLTRGNSGMTGRNSGGEPITISLTQPVSDNGNKRMSISISVNELEKVGIHIGDRVLIGVDVANNSIEFALLKAESGSHRFKVTAAGGSERDQSLASVGRARISFMATKNSAEFRELAKLLETAKLFSKRGVVNIEGQKNALAFTLPAIEHVVPEIFR